MGQVKTALEIRKRTEKNMHNIELETNKIVSHKFKKIIGTREPWNV